GFGKAGSDAGTRGEVDDLVELHAAEQVTKRAAVCDVALDELKRFREGLNVADVAAFELRVVEVVEVVEGPNVVAGMKQPLADVRANETSASGYEKIHRRKLANEDGEWKMEDGENQW